MGMVDRPQYTAIAEKILHKLYDLSAERRSVVPIEHTLQTVGPLGLKGVHIPNAFLNALSG